MSVRRAKIHYVQRVHPEVFRIGLKARGISSSASPGQFYLIRATDGFDPLLPRPFALHRRQLQDSGARRKGDGLEILVQVVGRGTELLSRKAVGAEVDVMGPLGCGWTLEGQDHPVMVAGGIGVASFVALAEEMPADQRKRSRVLLGARSPERLWCLEDLERRRIRVYTAVERGKGHCRGTVFDLLMTQRDDIMQVSPSLFVCGPPPMLKRVAQWAIKEGVRCQVSLEAPMACGVGVCLGCAVKGTRSATAYLRVCQEGPVMDAREVDWAAWDAC
jgi:dihydroorotate dehydrogenase electron transfer subunit